VGHAATLNLRLDGGSGELGSHDQVRAELTLLRRAVECVQDGIVITALAAEGNSPEVVYANPAFDAIVGDADSYATQCDDAGDASLWACLKQSHQVADVYSADIEHRGGDGSLLLHLRSELVRDESGRITHRIGVLRDGTRQANLEDAVRRNERLACVGLLAAAIAHEINNPTGSALLAAETALALKDSPDASDRVTACLQNIVTSMDRCGRIVRTLLRYSRQEPSEKQACCINDVAEQAVELGKPYAASHGAQVRLNLDPDVPLTSMNPLEIELVLLNLIRNAVEAGQGNVAISVGTARIENGVRVVVSDNGCGMSKEQVSHIFDPLFTTRRHLGGSGLGMSIALGIVKGHEGRMDVTSQEGKGTTVTIDLPVAACPLELGGNQGQDNHGSDSGCGG
jgi:signal transduction histidine kinase